MQKVFSLQKKQMSLSKDARMSLRELIKLASLMTSKLKNGHLNNGRALRMAVSLVEKPELARINSRILV